jgi:hypothetical protein
MNIIKNENGTLTVNDIQIISSYNKETKQHTFNLLKTGCVPVQHIGNHLTLRNNLSKLVEQVESTFTPPMSEEEIFSDSILDITEFVELPLDENAPTSESEDYNLFKDYLQKFTEATEEEEKDSFAATASSILLNMELETV